MLRAALAGEKARARETVGHLQAERSSVRYLSVSASSCAGSESGHLQGSVAASPIADLVACPFALATVLCAEQMKTQIAQLKGEIEVQTLVIERTEEVIREKHRLASECKRLQARLPSHPCHHAACHACAACVSARLPSCSSLRLTDSSLCAHLPHGRMSCSGSSSGAVR